VIEEGARRGKRWGMKKERYKETQRHRGGGGAAAGCLLPLRRQDVDVDQFVLVGGHRAITGAVL
jgi:hypothetical protein